MPPIHSKIGLSLEAVAAVSAAIAAIASVSVIVQTRNGTIQENGVSVIVQYAHLESDQRRQLVKILKDTNANVPEGLLVKLAQQNKQEAQTEKKENQSEIKRALPKKAAGEQTPDAFEGLSRLNSDTRSVRYAARDELAGFVRNCLPGCTPYIASLLPDEKSLAGSTYRLSLAVALAVARQAPNAFADADTVAFETLKRRISGLTEAGDPVLEDAARTALTKL